MSTVELKKHDREIEFITENPINDVTAQKRCFVAELVKNALTKFFDEEDIQINNAYSLYNLPIINEELNIIDFEINSLSVHVIPTIDRAKNINVYLSRIYRLYNYKPDVVIFVNFSKALTKMDILGFSTKIDLANLAIPKVQLQSADELIDAIKTINPSNNNISDNTINATKELMLAFIENSLSEEGRLFFIKNLINSKAIRKNYKLFCALNSDFISIAKEYAPETTDNQLPINETNIPEESNFEELVDSTDITETPAETSEEEISAVDIFQDDSEELSIDSTDSVDSVDIAEIDISEELTEQLTDEPEETIKEKIPEPDLYKSDDTIDTSNKQTGDTAGDLSFENQNDEDFDLSEAIDEEIPLNPLEESIDIPTKNFNEPSDSELLPEIDMPVEDTSLSENSDNLLNQNVEQPILLEENIQPAEEPKSNNEGDNIFDFLSDMTDPTQSQETQNTVSAPDIAEASTVMPIEESTQEIPQSFEQPQEVQQDENFANSMNNMNMAFSNDSQLNAQSNTSMQNNTVAQQQIPTAPVKNNTKKSPLIPALLVIILMAGGYNLYKNKDTFLSYFNKSDNIQGLTEEQDNTIPPPISSDVIGNSGTTENKTTDVPPPPSGSANSQTTPEQLPALPNTVEPPKPKNLNDAIATALSKDYSGVRISKVSWEVSETLANNPSVSRYLTIAGKSIKNSLSQDLASATESSFKDNIAVTITYKKDGSISKTEMATSSGSEQIDNIILKSVKDTLGYIKMPSLNLNKAEYQIKLIIRL